MVFKNSKAVETVRGADGRKLADVIKKLAAEADSGGTAEAGFGEASGSGSSGSTDTWIGAELPRGYKDVTDQVDVKGLDLLNADSDIGTARDLFDSTKPSALGQQGKGKATAEAKDEGGKRDWVESDTDEQLMLFVPFYSTLKVHTLQVTSLPSSAEDLDDVPMRPKTIKLYSNQAHVLGFEEADEIQATQTIELGSEAWDAKTGTAKVELRFVKFQNVTTLVIFVVDGDGSGEKVRIDRLRILGEAREKREMGKLEKIGDGGD